MCAQLILGMVSLGPSGSQPKPVIPAEVTQEREGKGMRTHRPGGGGQERKWRLGGKQEQVKGRGEMERVTDDGDRWETGMDKHTGPGAR